MYSTKTILEGVFIIEPKRFEDSRGWFSETWNQNHLDTVFDNIRFVQDNHSKSMYGVLRGLHFQKNKAQGKLIRVVHGHVYDFFVDLRRESSTFGRAFGIEVNSDNKLQVWLPPGLAHGFVTLSSFAYFEYKFLILSVNLLQLIFHSNFNLLMMVAIELYLEKLSILQL